MNYRNLALLFALAGALFAQADVHRGTVERIKVHGQALEGNLEGDSPDRDVSIYLPPSYATEQNRRYPVIYLLHGYTDSDDLWFGSKPHFINVPTVTDKALASGTREMIIVMPNAYTAYQGSMYSSSPTTGDWEAFVTHDLVSYIDAHYRTIPEVASRGLAGHSMGGYGTVRIGMKNPEVFSSLYILTPAAWRPIPPRCVRKKRRPYAAQPNWRKPISEPKLSSHRPRPGRPIRRTRRCSSTSRIKTASYSRR